MKEFVTKDFLVTNPWKSRQRFNYINLPRQENGEAGDISRLYKITANWLVRNKITCCAGPVCSGAVMAYALSVASAGKLKPVFLNKATGRKGAYKPSIHPDEVEVKSPYILIDDVIDSGVEILNSLRICRISSGEDPFAIIIMNIFLNKESYENRFDKIPIFRIGFRNK